MFLNITYLSFSGQRICFLSFIEILSLDLNNCSHLAKRNSKEIITNKWQKVYVLHINLFMYALTLLDYIFNIYLGALGFFDNSFF